MLNHITIVALKDGVFIETKRAKVAPLNQPGVAAQDKLAEGPEQLHGITLRNEQQIEIDVSDRQLAKFKEAAAAGDIEIHGVPAQMLQQVNVASVVPAVDHAQDDSHASPPKKQK